jgi:hypothetical protein
MDLKHIVLSIQGSRVFLNVVNGEFSYYELIGMLTETIRCVQDFCGETITNEANPFPIEIKVKEDDVNLVIEKLKLEETLMIDDD